MRLERHDGTGILFVDTGRHNAINDAAIREAHVPERTASPG
jgi:hypothetical protein